MDILDRVFLATQDLVFQATRDGQELVDIQGGQVSVVILGGAEFLGILETAWTMDWDTLSINTYIRTKENTWAQLEQFLFSRKLLT